MPYPTLKEINNRDIIDFLSSLGYQPQRISGRSYWYTSMLPNRSDNTPSFKVNRATNRWIDFGYDGREHSFVDLAMLLFNCTVREVVVRLSNPTDTPPPVSHQKPDTTPTDSSKLEISETCPIQSEYLLRYLWERRIPISVARRFCVEARYTFDHENFYYAIAFPTDAGGWNLRSKYHKYSSSPQSPTLIPNNSKRIVVFEGSFDMMTLFSILRYADHEWPDLLVLNGAGFFMDCLSFMDTYTTKHLFLDNDHTGDALTTVALARNNGYLDHRPLYRGYKDLNAWACRIGTSLPLKHLDSLPVIAAIPAKPS
jgi:hypothetical protein